MTSSCKVQFWYPVKNHLYACDNCSPSKSDSSDICLYTIYIYIEQVFISPLLCKIKWHITCNDSVVYYRLLCQQFCV